MTDEYYMHMDGQEVFKFAVTKVPECINQVLAKASLSPDDIDCYVLHQANVRIIASVAKRLGISIDKLPVNLNKYGNTSAATIPILFDELRKAGTFDNAKRIIFSGFGGGLTWGASLVEL
jgi:3-oxoacyl-[acyl-carrier-protein] synthase-3